MYRCGAKCCDQQNLSMDEVHRCIDRCSEPVNRAQALIQNEIQMFQVNIYVLLLFNCFLLNL